MRTAFGRQWWAIGFLAVAICLSACSVPNLEEPECREARDVAREFYSFHFGNDMHPTTENLKLREKFLTPELMGRLSQSATGEPKAVDPFTGTDDYPKAFRVGECTIDEPQREVHFRVLLFWKDDTRSEQKEILVGLRKETAGWLINAVSPLVSK